MSILAVSRLATLLVARRVAQRPQIALGHLIRHRERIPAEHVDVLMRLRRQLGYVLIPELDAVCAQMGQYGLHEACVPQHDHVEHQAERTELVYGAFAVVLAQVTA